MAVRTVVMSWEELASELPKDAPDIDRLMAAVFYRFEVEGKDVTDMSIIAGDFFRQARWPRPSNLPATANHCDDRGWLSSAGMDGRTKLWRITRKGYDYIRTHLMGVEEG